MIIEVVDVIIPRLLRIARVVDFRNNELKIIYDGFDKKYEYWVEDDNPDIHPVGWSSQTNHPIEMPQATHWSCVVPGCKGYGNSSISSKIDNYNLEDCPYEIDSWKTAIAELGQPDRLKNHNVLITSTLGRLNVQLDANNIEPACDTVIDNSLCNDNIPGIDKKKLCKHIGLSTVGYNSNSVLMDPLCRYWTRYNAQLGVPLFNTTYTRTWSVHKLALYVQKVVTYCNSDRKTNQCSDCYISDCFINQEIDGETFLMLNQDDLIKTLRIPLGPAIQIFYAITTLRQRKSDYDLFQTLLPKH